MRKSMADRIEEYIKVLIARSGSQQIEIQRAELAETFSCVPSQVTYVIATRFTEELGYLTESRRGGKGFIRISCCELDIKAARESQRELLMLINRLSDTAIISKKEEKLLKHIISRGSEEITPEGRSQFYDAFKFALGEFLEGK